MLKMLGNFCLRTFGALRKVKDMMGNFCSHTFWALRKVKDDGPCLFTYFLSGLFAYSSGSRKVSARVLLQRLAHVGSGLGTAEVQAPNPGPHGIDGGLGSGTQQ